MNDEELFARRTRVGRTPFVPEVALHVADAIVSLWEELGAAPPYWAFPWVGGQALARHVLDHPSLVAGKRVLDVGTGSGLCAVAAAQSGALAVRATDIDPRAVLATQRNAALNGAIVNAECRDVLDELVDDDVILVGDLFYEERLARRVLAFLRAHARRAVVLVGDPGREYFAADTLELLARYDVPTTRDLEGRETRDAGVFRVR